MVGLATSGTFYTTHIDLIHRLSAAPLSSVADDPPGQAADPVRHDGLTPPAAQLLCTAVQQSAREAEAAVQADEVAATEVRQFLELPRVQRAACWKDLFTSEPPRGTLARLARRFSARLHETCGHVGWQSRKEFRMEMRRIKAWYKHGKKTSRARLRNAREDHADQRQPGLRSAWTQKVNTHYKRLRSRRRLTGLFRWRIVSRAMRLAGVPQQSGTVSVERIWSFYDGHLPRPLRCMTLEWFNMLSKILFLKHLAAHFLTDRMPALAQNDAALAVHLDTMLKLSFEASDDQEVQRVP